MHYVSDTTMTGRTNRRKNRDLICILDRAASRLPWTAINKTADVGMNSSRWRVSAMQDSSPLATIVIVNYNYDEFLAAAIDSAPPASGNAYRKSQELYRRAPDGYTTGLAGVARRVVSNRAHFDAITSPQKRNKLDSAKLPISAENS
jgi:hypothetical protein